MSIQTYFNIFYNALFTLAIFSTNGQALKGSLESPELWLCNQTEELRYRIPICSSKLVFTGHTTELVSDCICLSGVWLIVRRNCCPEIVVSSMGCVMSPEIKALQFIEPFRPDDFFAVIMSSKYDFAWKTLRPVQNSIVKGHIWLFNGVLSRSETGRYCAERWDHRKNASRKLYNQVAWYTISGYVTVQYSCLSDYRTLVFPDVQYPIITAVRSECSLNCSKRILFEGNTTLKPSREKVFPLMVQKTKSDAFLVTSDKGKSSLRSNVTAENNSTIHSRNLMVRYIHHGFLVKMIEYGFYQNKFHHNFNNDSLPVGSFRVLNMLPDIVYKTCAGRVAESFLRIGYSIFRTAYATRGSNLKERLQPRDENDIVQFLNECEKSISPLNFNAPDGFCPDKVIETVEKDGEQVPINFTTNLDDLHMSVEVVWNMIDLAVAVCIQPFAKSYTQYHKMEQAMEKLFIKDLKILWQSPPKNSMLYTRIYGPNWKFQAENLERCLQAVYITHPKLSRLRRPIHRIKRGDLTNSSAKKNDVLPFVYMKPIRIPPLQVLGARSKGNEHSHVILKDANLVCQKFDVSRCVQQRMIV